VRWVFSVSIQTLQVCVTALRVKDHYSQWCQPGGKRCGPFQKAAKRLRGKRQLWEILYFIPMVGYLWAAFFFFPLGYIRFPLSAHCCVATLVAAQPIPRALRCRHSSPHSAQMRGEHQNAPTYWESAPVPLWDGSKVPIDMEK